MVKVPACYIYSEVHNQAGHNSVWEDFSNLNYKEILEY